MSLATSVCRTRVHPPLLASVSAPTGQVPPSKEPTTRLRLLCATLVLLFVTSALNTFAQNPTPGLPVNTPQIPVPLGSINPVTGNVHLEIPIASIPQRNSDPMVAKLVYDTTYHNRVFGANL